MGDLKRNCQKKKLLISLINATVFNKNTPLNVESPRINRIAAMKLF